MMIVEIGWWGLIAYLLGVVWLLRSGIRACLAGEPFGVAALAAIGLTIIDAVFFNGSVSLVFWVLMAFALRDEFAPQPGRIAVMFERVA